MFKNLLVILVLIGITLQVFNKLVLIVDYQVNKTYISANFCENKDKPSMHCEGKCHLIKQLKSLEKTENTPQSNVKVIDEILLFSSFDRIKIHLIQKMVSCNSLYTETKSSSLSRAIFHPPQA